jgi:F0F1-type ATP synthase assembly protein I
MNENKPEASQLTTISKGLVQGSAIGVQAGCLGVGLVIGALLLGLWLDGQFHTRPWFTLGFLVLSMPASVYAIYRFALRAARVTQNRERLPKQDEPPL